MEHSVLSKAVDSAYQSFGRVSSWLNTLTESIRENIELKENRGCLSNKCQHGNVSSPQCLEKERCTSALDCSFYHVDTTNSNTVFRNWQKSFRENTKDGYIKMDQMDSSSNSEVDLLNGHPVSNPDVQRRRSLLGEEEAEEEKTIYAFRQRSRTYDVNGLRCSAYNDLRKTDLQSSTSSNDSKRIVSLKGNHTSSNSRRISICSVTKVNTWHIVSEDNNDEAYSENYSVYVENVLKSRTEREQHIIPKEDNEASMCSQSNTLVSEFRPVQTQSVTGSLKVCVQHFETTKTLRVIVLTASNLNAKKGHIYPKLTIHYRIVKKKSKTMKLPKVKANTLVVFNATGFFENIDEEKIEELILKVRLYQKEGVFKSKKCLGELVIPVFKYDLSMDTNIKGKLRHKNSQSISDKFDDYGDDDNDLEVLSDDRSISAKVVEVVKPGSRYSSPNHRRRVNSLPTKMRHGTRYNAN